MPAPQLRALGCDQPGRHRHRARAQDSGGDRHPHRGISRGPSKVSRRSPGAMAAAAVGSGLDAARPPMPLRAGRLCGARSRERLGRLRGEALVLQFGGAVGTLAALDRGLDITDRLAALLRPAASRNALGTATDARRGRVGFGNSTSTCGKIAGEARVPSSADRTVAEAFEPAASGRGGSSTMPHKRNPVAATAALAAATMAPKAARDHPCRSVQNERALGGSQQMAEPTPRSALVRLRQARSRHRRSRPRSPRLTPTDAGQSRADARTL